MVKLSHLIALAAGLCLYSANAVTTTELPDLPSLDGYLGGGLYHAKVGGGGGSGGTTTGGSTSGDGLTSSDDVTTDDKTDDTTSEDGTGDIPEAEKDDDSGEVISINDPTTVSNPFPKGGVRIHKSNKTSKSNKDGGNSVKDTNGQTAKSTTTSTYLRG